MELLVLSLFAALVLCSVVLRFSILYALGAGLILFLLYGLRRGFALTELLKLALEGIRTAGTVLIMLVLIGVLTAVWRLAGTIPAIVVYASGLIRPQVLLLMCFWLNCLVSVLTGTAFGTAATMGVVCATMASAAGCSPLLMGGAVLAGSYFGDRCSPLSSSALLVASLTESDIFHNIRGMVRTALMPFLLSSALYLLLGLLTVRGGTLPDLRALFGQELVLHPAALLPAVLILVLCLCRVPVKRTMLLSILAAGVLSLTLQHQSPLTLLRTVLTGYTAATPEAGALLDGGGIVSMLRVIAIIVLSASYSELFHRTGLLDGLCSAIARLSRRIGSYAALLCVSLAVSMLVCNQTLTIMLAWQLFTPLISDGEALALKLENSAVVLPALVPWAISAAVPLASVGAPGASVAAAWFLYLLPLWCLLRQTHFAEAK